MRLEIRGRGIDVSEALYGHVNERVTRAFDRVSDRVRKVVVRVGGGRSPRGGYAPQHCQVRVELAGGGALMLEDIDDCAYSAVDRTVMRMRRVMHEHVVRRREPRRERRRAAAGRQGRV